MDVFNQRAFYSGTSGLILPVKNKSFYPPAYQNSSRLAYYGSLFNSIEINSTFYKLPLAGTIANWMNEVPENFKFTFKLWKEITHSKALAFKVGDVDRFFQIINHAGQKKGCVLVQFPPSLKIATAFQLEQLCFAISEADPENEWKIAFEFRHASWYDDQIYELMERFGFGIVIHDKPGSATPARSSDVSFRYLRFHGPEGNYRGHYGDDFIADYAGLVNEWISEGKSVFTYFNNTMGDALDNLSQLNTYAQVN